MENQARLTSPKQLGHMAHPQLWEGQRLRPEPTGGDHTSKVCAVGSTAVASMEACLWQNT